MAMPIIRSTPLTPSGQRRSRPARRERPQILAAKAEALYEAAESLPDVAAELHRLARPYLAEAGTTAVSDERRGDSGSAADSCSCCHPRLPYDTTSRS